MQEMTSECLCRDCAVASGREPGNSITSCQHGAGCNPRHVKHEKCCPWQGLWQSMAQLSPAQAGSAAWLCLGEAGGAGERNPVKDPEMSAAESFPISCSMV